MALDVAPTVNNQLNAHTYDLSGNMLFSPVGSEALTYDAENLPTAGRPHHIGRS